MKRPVDWHEQSLKNSREFYFRLVKELNQMEERVGSEARRLGEYQRQIEQAKKTGVTEFDAGIFLKRHRPHEG